MYRSFVTCDDPKGVVECRTIRKSKIASQKMEGKMKDHRTDKNSKASVACKAKKEEMVPKENAEDYPSSSSFQLLEISRGAQKLNQLFDSWSKGLSYDGHSKDIAKDLLKGALDLQESLTMLGKLQEASQVASQLKKKHKEKLERGRIDQVWCERTDSDQFGYQNPRLSADGSSRDSTEQLRNAIRDGLARQNLLANTSSHEKIRFHKRKKDSVSDIPSTSLTHSTHSTDSPMSQTALQKKGKAPNLIAKLMGLEYMPSKPLMQAPRKQLDMEKNSSLRRPVFDSEMPKLRKPQPQPIAHKVDSEQRTLEEILETVQFQGLLTGTSALEHKSRFHYSSDFHSKQKLIDDIHPIVLIKPLRAPCFDSEEAFAPIVREEGGLNTRMMMRKLRTTEVPQSIDDKEVTSKVHFKTEIEKMPFERVIQEEGAKDHIKVGVMPEEKEVKTIVHTERTVNANKMHRKMEAEKAPMKRLTHEEGAKDRKERAEENEAKKKWKDSSPRMKSSNLAAHKQQKEETTAKKVDKVQKLVNTSRKRVEREVLKITNVSRSEDQTELTPNKLRKPEIGSITTDEHISQQRTTTRKTISKHTTQTTIHSSKARKQKEKQSIEHTSARPVIENLECNDEEKRIDLPCNNDSVDEESTITHINEPSTEEEVIASKFQDEDHCGHSQNSLCIVTTVSSDYAKDVRSSEEADDEMKEIRVDGSSLKSENQLKDLLLSSLPFLNLAEEPFHINLSHPKTSPTSEIDDKAATDIKLSLDYAKEYIERRSLPDSQTRHPLLSYMGNSRIHLFIDQLVEEVCSGVESLRSYHRLARNKLHDDSLYATLNRDMKCKGAVSGVWDLGWRNGFAVDEVEQAVNDLEKLLVSELIGEVFS